MATRSRIGMLNADGTITSIYCHWDGYIEHNGHLLEGAWNTQERVESLMALGDLSILGSELGEKHNFDQHDTKSDWCLAYGRDRNETGVGARKHYSFAEFTKLFEEYNYLWDNGKWRCYDYKGRQLKMQSELDAA